MKNENYTEKKYPDFIFGILSLIFSFLPILGLLFAILSFVMYSKNKKINNHTSKAPKIMGIISIIINLLITILVIFSVYLFLQKKNIEKTDNQENIIEKEIIEDKNDQTIGNDKLGYLKIPEDWISLVDSNSSIKYGNLDNTSSVNISKDKAYSSIHDAIVLILNGLDNVNYSNIKSDVDSINDVDAGCISYSSNDGFYYKMWIMQDSKNYIRYITIIDKEENSSNFDIAYTYKFDKLN